MRGRVEGPERFHGIAEEVQPHRHLGVERVDVEDAAAQRVLAGLFAERLVVVAEILGEAPREFTEFQPVALPQDQFGARGGFGRGRGADQGGRRAGDQQRPPRVMAPMAQRRQHAQEVAIRLEGRHRRIGFGERAGGGLRRVQQREQLGGLLRQGLGRPEVGGHEHDHPAVRGFGAGHGRLGVRGHAGQGSAWRDGHPSIEPGRPAASNPTPYSSAAAAISSQRASASWGFRAGRPAWANQ